MGFFSLFKKQPKKEEKVHVNVMQTSTSSGDIPEEELIAIFAAVIQSYFSSTGKLVIRSYKRVEQNLPVWNRVARENLLNG